MRVLKWMLDRIEGKAGGQEHVFGTTPGYADVSWEGLDFSTDDYEQITSIETAAWKQELDLHSELFEQLKDRLPAELLAVQQGLRKRLGA